MSSAAVSRTTVLRLSPNEEVSCPTSPSTPTTCTSCVCPLPQAAALQRRVGQRRVTRILQVREQDRGLASKTRTNVQVKRDVEKAVLKTHLQENLANAQQKELRELEAQLISKVGELGEGHRAALNSMQVRLTGMQWIPGS